MDHPSSLPSQMYLLACDTTRNKLTVQWLGLVLRGAALADLYLGGHLTDVDGAPKVTGSASTDPLLESVRQEIAQSKPRRWDRWISRGDGAMLRAVQEQLVEQRIIRLERYRILGIFPATRVHVRDPRSVTDLRHVVVRTISGDGAIAGVDPREAALVALSAAGDVGLAVSRARAKQRRDRVAGLSDIAGPAIPALGKAVQTYKASNEIG